MDVSPLRVWGPPLMRQLRSVFHKYLMSFPICFDVVWDSGLACPALYFYNAKLIDLVVICNTYREKSYLQILNNPFFSSCYKLMFNWIGGISVHGDIGCQFTLIRLGLSYLLA